MILTNRQTIAIDYLEDNITTEVGYGGGAGGGKSMLGCYWQLKQRLKYPQTRGLIGRAKLKTLKETTLQSFFEVAKMQGVKNGVHYNYNQQSSQINFKNGSVILLKDLFFYPSDPEFDELGSLEITDAFLDESAQIVRKAFNTVQSRIRYKLDENDLIPKILWSSNPNKGWNYSEFYLPYKKGTLKDYRQFVPALATDNPFISKHYIDNLNKLPKNQKERLLYGNWEYDDDPTLLIDYEKLFNMWTNNFVKGGENYISADIARFGKDHTLIGYWNGWRLEKIYRYSKMSVTESAQKIKDLAFKHKVPLNNIVVDEDGVGGGVVDILKCKGFVNNSKALNGENFNHLKSQCYFKLAEMINTDKIYVVKNDFQDLINEELEQVKQYNMDKDTTKQIIPKDKVKELLGRSPDFSDMMAMRAFFEYQYNFEFHIA